MFNSNIPTNNMTGVAQYLYYFNFPSFTLPKNVNEQNVYEITMIFYYYLYKIYLIKKFNSYMSHNM